MPGHGVRIKDLARWHRPTESEVNRSGPHNLIAWSVIPSPTSTIAPPDRLDLYHCLVQEEGKNSTTIAQQLKYVCVEVCLMKGVGRLV